jgi:DNA-directed RNA polymerase subunit RPC12/RpoP
MKVLEYVGPEEIREQSSEAPRGTPIASHAALIGWIDAHGRAEDGWATYVVGRDGELLVAPRRSEHVACAGGQDVLAAGEIRFDARGAVVEVTNNSTGYCPPEDCWAFVRAALDRAGLRRPDGFTFEAKFRRCPRCGARNLVKDEWYVCAICDADLPTQWNFDR